MFKLKLKKYFNRTSSNETSSTGDHTSLVRRDHHNETRYIEQVSQSKRQEVEGPNPLTGEGMESRKLRLEANKSWHRLKGTNVDHVYVKKLAEAFDQRYKKIVFLVMQDKNLTEKVLDCSRNDFLESLEDLKDDLKENLLKTVYNTSDIKEELRARALKYLEVVADLQEHQEWRLEHAGSLKNKGRIRRKEVFKSLDENNFRDYLVSDSEVIQSIRILRRMYKEVEGTYTPGEKGIRTKQFIDGSIGDYGKYTNKFMIYFTQRTWLDNPPENEKITADDIKKMKELGTDIVNLEAILTQLGIEGFENYKSKNRDDS